MILFISGGISGISGYALNFNSAAKQLKDAGYETVTPVDNTPLDRGTDEHIWTQYMRRALIQMLTHCDGVALLPGWNYSRGSQVEQALATELGMPVKCVDEWIWGDYAQH